MRRAALALTTATVVLAGVAPAGAAGRDGGALAAPGAGGAPGIPETPAAPSQAPPASGRTTRSAVNLRARPGDGRILARLPRATRLTIACQRNGPVAPGRLGPSRVWDRVSRSNDTRGWVADGLLDTGPRALVAPLCNVPALGLPALPGVRAGPCAIRRLGTPLPPFRTRRSLIAAVLPGARASRVAYRVPVAVTLAQTILETGGGRFTSGTNNFFGLKAQPTARPGRYAFGTRATGCVLRKTREAERGRLVITIGAFRAYATIEESILDHGERLAVNPVYRAAFAHTQRPRRFAQIIARHYATDPRYAAKLLGLIDRYDLDDLDDLDEVDSGLSRPPAAAGGRAAS